MDLLPWQQQGDIPLNGQSPNQPLVLAGVMDERFPCPKLQGRFAKLLFCPGGYGFQLRERRVEPLKEGQRNIFWGGYRCTSAFGILASPAGFEPAFAP